MFYCPASDTMIDIPAVLQANSEAELWALASIHSKDRNHDEPSVQEVTIDVPERSCITAMQYRRSVSCAISKDFEEIACSHEGTMFALAGNAEALDDGTFALRVTETCCMEASVDEMISTPFEGKISKIIYMKDV